MSDIEPHLLPPGNTDEAKAGGTLLPPLWARAPADAAERERLRTTWLEAFGAQVYGAIPAAPQRLAFERLPLDGEDCERIRLILGHDGRSLVVDLALWLPPPAASRVKLVVGLDFLGPAAVLEGDGFPLDPFASVHASPEYGLQDGRLAPQIRGAPWARWPVGLLRRQGFGLLLGCYGSFVPDRADRWQSHGVWPLLGLRDGDARPGAISLWAWSLLRLLDVARTLPEVDPERIFAAGFSRLGKAALWATASDARLAGVFAACAGCLGPKPSRRRFGETPRSMALRYPHWVSTHLADAARDPERMPVEQHQLLAAIAPRHLHLASASADPWADPRGEYAGLYASLPAWPGAPTLPSPDADLVPGERRGTGRIVWHLRPGGHAMLPHDWREALVTLASP